MTHPPSLAALLETVAAQRGTAPALVSRTERMDYGTLLRAARRVAWHIAEHIPPGAAVATLVPHTPDGVAGLLGGLLSGRTCIVLNPLDPTARIAGILNAARPAAVLADAAGPDCAGMPRMDLAAALAAPDTPGFPPPLPPDAPAIVHFTSGSSGVPKGIAFTMAAMLHRCADGYPYGPSDVSIGPSMPSTSAGLCLVVAPLLGGGQVLLARLASEGATALLGLMRDNGATCAAIGPAILRMLLRLPGARAAFAQVRLIRIGGAGITGADLAAWREVLPASTLLLHRYASTEGGVVTMFPVPPDYACTGMLPSGHLVPGLDATIVDDAGHPVAAGQSGELVLRGPHLALGEWHHGDFVPGRMHPDPADPCCRVFATGDIFRREPDGMLRFLSRKDRQVKINGVRVEPGEVEAVLRRDPRVTDAAVLAIESTAEMRLLAYVAAPGADPADLRPALSALLAEALVPAMRPSGIIILDRLPTLPGGKTDIAALRTLAAP